MDSGSQIPGHSKRKFKPGPPKPSLRPITPTSNTEAETEEDNKKAARQIAKRIAVSKPETKASPCEVTFQPNMSSLSIRSFGVPKEDDNHGSDVNPSSSGGILPAVSSDDILPAVSSARILPAVSSPTARKDGEEVHNLVTRTEEGYVEPWDYENSYYPTVLPWRKPYSGDPELRNQEEFGDVAKHIAYDENSINSAEKLGLTSGEHCKNQMFFFKIPDIPVVKKPTGENTKKSVWERSNTFEDLPEGFMGKMLLYKSGAIKMKIGDILFDVSPGLNVSFHSDVAAIDTEGKKCCRIGSLGKLVTVVPDVESLLNSVSYMETHN